MTANLPSETVAPDTSRSADAASLAPAHQLGSDRVEERRTVDAELEQAGLGRAAELHALLDDDFVHLREVTGQAHVEVGELTRSHEHLRLDLTDVPLPGEADGISARRHVRENIVPLVRARGRLALQIQNGHLYTGQEVPEFLVDDDAADRARCVLSQGLFALKHSNPQGETPQEEKSHHGSPNPSRISRIRAIMASSGSKPWVAIEQHVAARSIALGRLFGFSYPSSIAVAYTFAA